MSNKYNVPEYFQKMQAKPSSLSCLETHMIANYIALALNTMKDKQDVSMATSHLMEAQEILRKDHESDI